MLFAKLPSGTAPVGPEMTFSAEMMSGVFWIARATLLMLAVVEVLVISMTGLLFWTQN